MSLTATIDGFQFRLDHDTPTKLRTLIQTFDRSAAEIIRQLITQARLEDFLSSWQLAVDERRQPDVRQPDRLTP
jgi:hypothetical protein